MLGGLSRRAWWIKKQRRQGRLDLLVDGGACLFEQVPLESAQDRQKAAFIADMYRRLGYKAVCVGSRDLAAGVDFLLDLNKRGMPFISANLYYQGRRPFPPYRVFTLKGLRIGVTALTSGAVPLRTPGRDEILVKGFQEVLPGMMDRFREEADFLVLLSNLPPGTERKLLEKWPQFDLVISSGRVGATKSPVITMGRPLVSASALGKSMGLVTLLAAKGQPDGRDPDGLIVKVTSQDFRLTDKIPEDKAAAHRIKAFLRRLKFGSADALGD